MTTYGGRMGVTGCARAAAIVLVAGLASCDDGKGEARGGSPGRVPAGGAGPGAANQRAGGGAPPRMPSAPAERPLITFHDVLQTYIRRNQRGAEVWAITLMVDTVPSVTKEAVQAAVGSVLGAELAAQLVDDNEPGPFQMFRIDAKRFLLSVEVMRRVYVEEAAIELMPLIIGDEAVLDAFGSHRAFVSVSVVARDPETQNEMYEVLGKIAACFLDSTVVCVHCRTGDVYVKPDDDVARALRGEDPKGVLGYFLDRRVTGVVAGDAGMRAAMDEARRRLPEFLAEWNAKSGPGTFMVKARFEAEGRTEYMWIVLGSIHGEQVSGQLANQPRVATHLHEGQTVTVPMSTVMDWVYATQGRGAGAFTDPRLGAALRGG